MSENTNAKAIKEWAKVDRATFETEIVPSNKPAVLRGLVDNWATVIAAKLSNKEAVRYLASLDNHTPAYTIVGQPEINGRFFYSNELTGTNFIKTQAAITATLEQLYALKDTPSPHSVAVQAAPVRQTMPEFEQGNSMPLLDSSIEPTAWLGNRATVAPHYDVHENIACVAMGRRRFTVFPPDQISNLYVGPTLNSPGGVPISMVDLKEPDFDHHPNYKAALEHAQTAVLEPGDAIYIPTPWWHSVESLESLNLLINYWWGGLDDGALSPNHSLMHSMLTIAKLEPAQREAWRHFFDYLVFKETGDPQAHLPDDLHDVAATLSAEQRHGVLEFLKSKLK